jgi:hypothetical protein
VIGVSLYAQIGQSHAMDSGSDDAGIKEDFLQRKHLDFMFSAPPEMKTGGDSMIQCVFLMWICHFAKLERGLSKKPLIIFCQ